MYADGINNQRKCYEWFTAFVFGVTGTIWCKVVRPVLTHLTSLTTRFLNAIEFWLPFPHDDGGNSRYIVTYNFYRINFRHEPFIDSFIFDNIKYLGWRHSFLHRWSYSTLFLGRFIQISGIRWNGTDVSRRVPTMPLTGMATTEYTRNLFFYL